VLEYSEKRLVLCSLLRQHQKFQETLEAYKSCLDCFQLAIKWHENGMVKEQYQRFYLEYLIRAEKLKEILQEYNEEEDSGGLLCCGDSSSSGMETVDWSDWIKKAMDKATIATDLDHEAIAMKDPKDREAQVGFPTTVPEQADV
jgi:hypothetical protein